MVSEKIREEINPDTASPLEIVRNGLEIERLERIPLNLINTENALVDDVHADELGASMKQKRGQITPIAVRAIEDDEGKIAYDVIDGFHRTEGKRRSGDKEINATVIYNCSDEEMFDLRILAASSVRSVQFPRIAKWITSSYETTPFAEKGLAVAQAFAIAVNDSQRSYTTDFSREEIKELKEWTKAKVARWGKSLTAVYAILRTVANADPELVKEVRTSGGGKDRTGRITPARLSAVVDAFPGKENFAAQRATLQIVVGKRLSAEETTLLAEKAKNLITQAMDEETIYNILKEVPIEQVVYQIKTADEDEAEDFDIETEFNWDEIEPDEDELNFIENDQEIDDDLILPLPTRNKNNDKFRINPGAAGFRNRRSISPGEVIEIERQSTGAFSRGEANDPEQLQRQVIDLQKALEKAHKLLAEGRIGQADAWWRTAPYLTPTERACMERILYNNEDADKVGNELKITGQYAILLIKSSFAKRHYNEGKRNQQN